MRFNAKKLTEDLIAANKAACEAVESIVDGGSAKLDSVFLQVPRVRETTVLEAINNAGLYCRGKTQWFSPGYMITPKTGGQGDKRSKGVELMAKHLREAGWDTLIFYKVD